MAHQKIIQQGAEALILLHNNKIVTKKRIKKSYRINEIDEKIRKLRTRSEAKLLEKALHVIPVPKIKKIDEKNKELLVDYIKGKKLSKNLDSFPLEKQKKICRVIGKNVAKLHDSNIIHGDLTTSNMILARGGGFKINKFKTLLYKLKKLKLPHDEYVVFGSGPLSIRGIRESKDIYIVVKRKLWNKLAKKYPIKNGKLIKIGPIEVYGDGGIWFKDINKLIKDADIFKGIKFVNLKHTLEWKKAFGREKDKKDVILIEQYHSASGSEQDNFKIYFIDFGLGFISHKIEDKAVDLHLLKEALEAKHFKHWEKLFVNVLKGYSLSKNHKAVLERLKIVEKRGRYKGRY